MNLKTFERGIHPSYHKELTNRAEVVRAVLPHRVVIPLVQHIGAPCRPVVKKGDLVEEGQVIGEAGGFVSVPVHSSIGGKVKEIALSPHPGGGKVLAVVIDGDGTEKDWVSAAASSESTANIGAEIERLGVDELRRSIREAGIVGMGGAAFPTAVKLTPPKENSIDTVILNGCECEPFLSADHRLMVEAPEKVVLGLKAICRTLGAKHSYIGVEDNKPDAIEALRGAVKKFYPGVEVVPLETKYPQGAEKMLIQALVRRKVPLGKLPMEVGVVVNNVATAIAVYDAIRYGKPLIERVVTISGNGIQRPANLLVRIGTSFEEVIDQCGGFRKSAAPGAETEVLSGGPMMGVAQTTLQVPVVKGTSGITVLTGPALKPLEYRPCIRCAACVDVCPMALMPFRIGDQGRLSITDGFKAWQGPSCIECGCCSFVCPSKRPLVQWIRFGKVKLREEEQKNAS